MQGSDDYFTDDFVLDDQAIAVLDQEEQKFSQAQHVKAYQPSPPVAKRQKTEQGWKPGLGNRTATLDDLDLPEISVQGDGTYGFGANPSRPKTTTPRPAGHANRVVSAGGGQIHAKPPSNASTRAVSNPAPVPYQQTRPPVPNRPPSFHRAPDPPPASQNVSRTSFQRQQSFGQQPRPPAPVPVSRVQPRQRSLVLTPQAIAPEPKGVSPQIEAMRLQNEELMRQNQKIQADLAAAQEKIMCKDGEVTILRKGKEKTAQDHAAEVAKLRASKEEALAALAQAQKAMKEEMERLKTQFTFKQHEMETSTRKPPMSIRAKRFAKDIPSTPAPVPSQIRGWNTGDAGAAGPSKPLPAGPRFDHIARSSPKATRHASKAVAENPRTMLPGFVNAFASSSPVRLRSSRSMKGKGREIPEDEGDDIFGRSGRLSPPSMFQSQFNNSGPPPISPPSSPTRPLPQNNDVDVQMVSEPPWENDAGLATDPGGRDNADIQMVDESDEALLDAYDEVEPMNWREQLHQIILTHAVPSSSSSTFHSLLRVPLPASLPFSSAEAYTTACSRVLEIIASSRHKTWDAATQVVSESLTQMASILNAGNLITPLIALINVSSTLVLTLPLFSTSFLTPPDGMGEDALPRILEVTFDVIRDRISPANIDKAPLDEKPGLLSLAQETVGLLEALTWDAPDELEGSLALIPRTQGILSVLLAEAQPIELLDRSVRLLVFLASRPQLFRHLLSFPGPDMPDPDYARIPHIERLCLLLVDPNHQGREAESMRTSILVLFAALSTAHADARTILLESQLLIPTLVFYLTHLVSPLWEDDETLMASPTSVSPLVRHLNQTLFLFYHLVIGAETVNLRQKLVHGRHRAFIGIMHMFTVTFGRLSLAEPPDWIASEDRSELEQMTDMARQLLELVVDGPEYDGVWATFQDDPDQDSATDDEEMEARRLETNEI